MVGGLGRAVGKRESVGYLGVWDGESGELGIARGYGVQDIPGRSHYKG